MCAMLDLKVFLRCICFYFVKGLIKYEDLSGHFYWNYIKTVNLITGTPPSIIICLHPNNIQTVTLIWPHLRPNPPTSVCVRMMRDSLRNNGEVHGALFAPSLCLRSPCYDTSDWSCLRVLCVLTSLKVVAEIAAHTLACIVLGICYRRDALISNYVLTKD